MSDIVERLHEYATTNRGKKAMKPTIKDGHLATVSKLPGYGAPGQVQTMTDIVQRLRDAKSNWKIGVEICDQAADEIERLRAENARLTNLIHERLRKGEVR